MAAPKAPAAHAARPVPVTIYGPAAVDESGPGDYAADPALTRRGVVMLVVVALVFVAVGVVIGRPLGRGVARSSAESAQMHQVAAVRAHVPPSFAHLTTSGDDLRSRLAAAPPGARVTTPGGTVEDQETFVDQHFQAWSTIFASDRLDDLGFTTAAVLDWTGTDGTTVSVALAEFDTRAHAASFASDNDRIESTSNDITGRVTIPGTPDCWIYQNAHLDQDGNRRALLDCVDHSVDVLLFFFPVHDFDAGSEVALLQRQLDALAR